MSAICDPSQPSSTQEMAGNDISLSWGMEGNPLYFLILNMKVCQLVDVKGKMVISLG